MIVLLPYYQGTYRMRTPRPAAVGKERRACRQQRYNGPAMGGGRTQKKKSKAARRGAAASSNAAKALMPEPQPEPEPSSRQRGPGALPMPRTMTLTRDDDGNAPGLRVVTYNILAQAYFENNPRQQATCPPGKRGQKARHAALVPIFNILSSIFLGF